MKLKSELAPKGLQFNPADFIISDKYATILTVISYPRLIGTGYLASLTNMSGVKMVIKHIPLPFSVLAKMLNKEISDLKSKYPLAIVTREFHKGKNVLVRATEIKSKNNLKKQDKDKEIEIDDWYIRQRGGR